MGQIWDRLKRVIRSNTTGVEYSLEDLEIAEDDELKKKIDQASTHSSTSEDTARRYKTRESNIDRSYRLLGINKTATIEQIKVSYRQKIREVHPDSVATKSKEEQEKAKRKALEINEAYQILKSLRNF